MFQSHYALYFYIFHVLGDYQERSHQYGKRLNKEAANLGNNVLFSQYFGAHTHDRVTFDRVL
jgi:hypothetical protein